MHISNPIEKRCRLQPSTLNNRRGVMLADPLVTSFTVTVPVGELPDLIAQLMLCYQECADARAVAKLLGRLAAEGCRGTRPAAVPQLGFVLAQGPKK